MLWSLVWFMLGWLLGGWALRDWWAALWPALATVLFLMLLSSDAPAVRAVSGTLMLEKGQSLLALTMLLAALYALRSVPSARLRLGLSGLLVPLAAWVLLWAGLTAFFVLFHIS